MWQESSVEQQSLLGDMRIENKTLLAMVFAVGKHGRPGALGDAETCESPSYLLFFKHLDIFPE